MKLAITYLKQQRRVIALIVFLLLLFNVCFIFYRMPLPAVIYPNLLCLFLCIIAIGIGFARMYRKKQLLEQIGQAAVFDFSALPAPDGEVKNMYQTLLRTLQNTCDTQANQTAKRYADMMDYYTLWAHQIKTPITAMQLYFDRHKDVANIPLQTQLQRIENYVEMVMVYLRLDAENTDYVIKPCSVQTIVQKAVKHFSLEFISKQIAVEIDNVDITVLSDEKWLLFVVEQIVSNALKYTPSGTIRFSLIPPATLCISDTGIGISKSDLPRVFEKGYTGYNGRQDTRASGIGLYLCQRICHQLHHTICITSEIGKGTTVEIGLEHRDIVHE